MTLGPEGEWSRPPSRLLTATLAAVLTVCLTAGCTPDAPPGTASRPTPPSSAPEGQDVDQGSTLQPAPVALDVEVARIAGRMTKEKVAALKHAVARTLTGYLDAALLRGSYPRASFTAALAPFRPALRPQALRDRAVLTNASIGRDTTRVVPIARRARLNVVAEEGTAVGVTARVRWAFRARVDRQGQRVLVSGRLLLTPAAKGGGWAVFGYDLTRGDPGSRPGPRVPADRQGHSKREPRTQPGQQQKPTKQKPTTQRKHGKHRTGGRS